MANATFYIISANTPQASPSGFIEYVIFLVHHFVQQNAKVYLNCLNRSHAEEIAEAFWILETDKFMPHNLVGEGPKNGTSVEIGFDGISPSWNRQIIINLADINSTFANQFTEVIDFVPCDENSKHLARARYKMYRQAGFQMQTIEIKHP